MEEDDRAWYMQLDAAWPKDMEQRRVADLRRFQLSNPDYKLTNGDIGGQRPSQESHGRKRRKPSPMKQPSLTVRWGVDTTLELLEAMKAYTRANRISRIGTDLEKWEAVATHLPNPWGLELREFANRCHARYMTLRRYLSPGDKRFDGRVMDGKVHESLADYHLICEQNKTPAP